MRSMSLIERLKFEIDYQADQAVFDLIQTDQCSKVRDQVWRQVSDQVWDQVRLQVLDQVRNQIKEENL